MSSYPYDFMLTADGVSHGFMCVTPPGSTKQLSVVEVGPPDVNRISTADAASHLDFAPQYDQPFSMASWTGGVGQLYFDGNDQTGYWWGNVSTHVDGKIYPPFVPSSYTHTIAADYTFYTKTAGAGRAIFKSWVTSAGVRTDYSYIDDSLMIIDPSSGSTTKAAPLSNSTFLATDMTFFEGVVVVCSPDNTVAGNDFWTYTVAAGPGTAAARNHTPFAVGSRPKFMCPVRDTLFAAVDNGLIYYTVDPTTDAWVGPIEASDKNFPWQNMVAVGDYLFCFTTAAGYSIDAAQRVEEVFWQWKDNPSTENFKCVATTGGRLYYNIGPEVYEYDPVATDGNNRSLSLARRDGFSVQQILGITTDEKYVYVQAKVRIPTLYSSSQMAILRGVRQPNGRINFECIYQETFVAAQYDRALTARPYGIGVNLYWATVDTGTGYGKVKYIWIPPDWDESNLTSSNGGYTFGEGYLYTSITRANYPDFSKRHLWIAVEMENITSNGVIEVAYSIDKGVNFTVLGTSATASNGLLTLALSNINSRTFMLRFKLTSSNGVNTPIIRVFDHHQRVRFKYLPQVQAGARCATGLDRLNGQPDTNRTQMDILDSLRTLRATDSAILYEDYLGNSFYVSLDSVSYRPTRHEKPTEKGEQEALITMSRADAGT